jgi:hypothetical protein
MSSKVTRRVGITGGGRISHGFSFENEGERKGVPAESSDSER